MPGDPSMGELGCVDIENLEARMHRNFCVVKSTWRDVGDALTLVTFRWWLRIADPQPFTLCGLSKLLLELAGNGRQADMEK